MTIPRELVDAARVDGAGKLRIFWGIVMPLSRPALAVVGLFTFLAAWSDYLGPLIYISGYLPVPSFVGPVVYGEYGVGFAGSLCDGSSRFHRGNDTSSGCTLPSAAYFYRRSFNHRSERLRKGRRQVIQSTTMTE